MEEEEDSELYGHKTEISGSTLHSYIVDRLVTLCAFCPHIIYRRICPMNEI